jgi:hypothetical protein
MPLLQHGRSTGWIAWWSLSTVAHRVLITWIYNNTGRSVLGRGADARHDERPLDRPVLDFGPGGYPYGAQRQP